VAIFYPLGHPIPSARVGPPKKVGLGAPGVVNPPLAMTYHSTPQGGRPGAVLYYTPQYPMPYGPDGEALAFVRFAGEFQDQAVVTQLVLAK
jgi:hypothetical protein